MERKLASIQQIESLSPIEGADKIETARMCNLGWEVVIRKNEFKIDDIVVYCEVDSILPEKPEFEFLRERHFRIKTIKLKKQVSQGIIFPLSILPSNNYKIDTDVTDLIGIKKHDPQLQEENQLKTESINKMSKPVKFLLQYAPFRYIYFKLNRHEKGWPEWLAKTNEERVQILLNQLRKYPNESFYISEKLDGSSVTFYTENIKKWCFNQLKFRVCSRNIRLGKGPNNYWRIAEKYNIEEKLLSLKKGKMVIQGEVIGVKIQDNKYKLPELDMYVFNVIDNGRKYKVEEMIEFCNKFGLKTVPILNKNWIYTNPERSSQEVIKELVDMSIGKSVLNKDVQREGIVCRLNSDPNISFKVINPEFLLKYGE